MKYRNVPGISFPTVLSLNVIVSMYIIFRFPQQLFLFALKAKKLPKQPCTTTTTKNCVVKYFIVVLELSFIIKACSLSIPG